MEIKLSTQNWPELYGRAISTHEYDEICRNLSGFFSILKAWNDKEKMRFNDERNSDLRNTNNSY